MAQPNSAPRTSSTVNSPCVAYRDMKEGFELIQEILGGTELMRRAGQRRLPKEEGEQKNDYNARLNRTELFEGLSEAIDGACAGPMSEAVSYVGTLGPKLQALWDDPDRTKRGMQAYVWDFMRTSIAYGKGHAVVEMPRIEENMNLLEETESGLRPHFVLCETPNVIGWRSGDEDVGEEKLTQLRLREFRADADTGEDNFGETVVHLVRVYSAPDASIDEGAEGHGRVRWAVWKKETGRNAKAWSVVDSGTMSIDEIPHVVVYTGRTGFMTSRSPMMRLAWMNLSHWQISSDWRNILHVVDVPMFCISGAGPKKEGEGEVISPKRVMRLADPAARAYWIEHQGAAIGASEKALDKIERCMTAFGLAPYLEDSKAVTATASNSTSKRATTKVQAWAEAVEAGMMQLFQFASKLCGEELPADFKINVHKEFAASSEAREKGDMILRAYQQRLISKKLAIQQLVKLAVLPRQLDIDAEIEQSNAEAPNVSDLFGASPFGGDPEKKAEDAAATAA